MTIDTMILNNEPDVTINGLVFDLDSMRETADCIRSLNSFVSDMNREQLMEHMIRTANDSDLKTKLGYVGIYGYLLTAYPVYKDRVGIRASVSAYLVKKQLVLS